MKALYERWTAISLPKRILGGMILGAVLGMVIPQAVGISILGNLFVERIQKGIAAPCLYFLPCYQFPLPWQSRATAASSAPLLPLPVQHTARRCDRGRRK